MRRSSVPTIGKVYFTSRKTKLGFESYKMESGWVFKYRGKESRIYEDKRQAEYHMMLMILVKKS